MSEPRETIRSLLVSNGFDPREYGGDFDEAIKAALRVFLELQRHSYGLDSWIARPTTEEEQTKDLK